MRKVLKAISRFSPHKATVLIQGETGTGKDLGRTSPACAGLGDRPVLSPFNCSNLVESLAKSQLFGHVLGAFTDAREMPSRIRSAISGRRPAEPCSCRKSASFRCSYSPNLLRAVLEACLCRETLKISSSTDYIERGLFEVAYSDDLKRRVKSR